MPNRISGKQGKGSRRVVRAAKRAEAEARNAKTAPERRASYRRGTKGVV